MKIIMECTLDLIGNTNPDLFIKLRAIPFTVKETKTGVKYVVYPLEVEK